MLLDGAAAVVIVLTDVREQRIHLVVVFSRHMPYVSIVSIDRLAHIQLLSFFKTFSYLFFPLARSLNDARSKHLFPCSYNYNKNCAGRGRSASFTKLRS